MINVHFIRCTGIITIRVIIVETVPGHPTVGDFLLLLQSHEILLILSIINLVSFPFRSELPILEV